MGQWHNLATFDWKKSAVLRAAIQHRHCLVVRQLAPDRATQVSFYRLLANPAVTVLSCTHKSDSVKTGVSRSCLSNSKSHFSDVVSFGICYVLKPKSAL